MGGIQKGLNHLALPICVCVFVGLFSFHVLAAKSVAKDETASTSVYEPAFAEDVSFLRQALTAQKNIHVEDAELLRSAIAELKRENANETLRLLDKIDDGSPLEEYARYYRSVALKKKGDHSGALALLPAKIAFLRRLDHDIFWHKADLLALESKISELRLMTSEALRKFPKDKNVKVKAPYYLGKGLLLAGQKAEAFREFQKVLVQEPGSEFDERTFALLKKKGVAVSEVLTEALLNLRAEKMIATGFAHKAIEIFREMEKRDPNRYRERVAFATFKARLYPEASRLYENLLESGQYVSSEASLMVSLAQACARQDDFTCAIATNEKIMKRFAGSSAASQAAGKLGFLYFDYGQYDRAFDFFAKNPGRAGRKLRNNARWYRFWSRYLAGKFPQALDEAKALLAANPRGEGALVFNYWMARCFDRMNKKQDAKSHYQKVASLDASGYYGLLARQRLKYARLEPKSLIHDSFLDHVPVGSGKPHYAGVQLDPALARAALLSFAGLDTYAFDEAGRVPKSMTQDSVLGRQIAGDYYSSFAVKDSARAGRVAGCDGLCGWRIGFPLAYRQYIEPFSSRWGLDDKIAYSVMRQESVFKPEALSYAYAYGLMQIIPPTGEEIAGKINYPGFHVGLLNQPRVNTLFGTFYLSYLMSKFGQEPIYAFAGYNAGPDAVGRWIKKYGNLEKDEFIELIPYEQTHDYARKVLVNYLIYHKLYR